MFLVADWTISTDRATRQCGQPPPVYWSAFSITSSQLNKQHTHSTHTKSPCFLPSPLYNGPTYQTIYNSDTYSIYVCSYLTVHISLPHHVCSYIPYCTYLSLSHTYSIYVCSYITYLLASFPGSPSPRTNYTRVTFDLAERLRESLVHFGT